MSPQGLAISQLTLALAVFSVKGLESLASAVAISGFAGLDLLAER